MVKDFENLEAKCDSSELRCPPKTIIKTLFSKKHARGPVNSVDWSIKCQIKQKTYAQEPILV